MIYFLLCICGIYILAIFCDIIFMKTGFLSYKYAYWISMLLASIGSACFATISWKKKKRQGYRSSSVILSQENSTGPQEGPDSKNEDSLQI